MAPLPGNRCGGAVAQSHGSSSGWVQSAAAVGQGREQPSPSRSLRQPSELCTLLVSSSCYGRPAAAGLGAVIGCETWRAREANSDVCGVTSDAVCNAELDRKTERVDTGRTDTQRGSRRHLSSDANVHRTDSCCVIGSDKSQTILPAVPKARWHSRRASGKALRRSRATSMIYCAAFVVRCLSIS